MPSFTCLPRQSLAGPALSILLFYGAFSLWIPFKLGISPPFHSSDPHHMIPMASTPPPPSFLSPIQIHDELIYEAPVGPAAKRVAQIVREEMESAVALAAPLRVKVKVGERWSQLREVARNAS